MEVRGSDDLVAIGGEQHLGGELDRIPTLHLFHSHHLQWRQTHSSLKGENHCNLVLNENMYNILPSYAIVTNCHKMSFTQNFVCSLPVYSRESSRLIINYSCVIYNLIYRFTYQ